jgi:hypothetical protein
MYCNVSEIAQTNIRLDDNIYSCGNKSIGVSCPRLFENTTIDECPNKTLSCDVAEGLENIFCTNATLMSRASLVCNSTTILNGININETTTILNCYPGSLPEKLASFIPTTEAPVEATTEKSLSFGAKVHVFLLKLIGRSDVLEKKETTTVLPPITEEDPRLALMGNETAWVPEALTIPPEVISTTSAPNISDFTTTQTFNETSTSTPKNETGTEEIKVETTTLTV